MRGDASGVAAAGNLVFVADRDGGMRILEVKNPNHVNEQLVHVQNSWWTPKIGNGYVGVYAFVSGGRRQPARAGADAPTQACGIWANRGAQVASQRCPILRVSNRILH